MKNQNCYKSSHEQSHPGERFWLTTASRLYGSPGGTFITYDLFLITYYLFVLTYFLLLICYYLLLSISKSSNRKMVALTVEKLLLLK